MISPKSKEHWWFGKHMLYDLSSYDPSRQWTRGIPNFHRRQVSASRSSMAFKMATLDTKNYFPHPPESLKKLWRVIINSVNEHTWPFGIWKCVKACMCVCIYIYIYIHRLLVSVSVWQSLYWFWAWRVGDGGLNLDRKLSIQLNAARHHAHQFLKGSPLKHVRIEFQWMSNFRAETDIAVPYYSKWRKCLTPCGTQKHASPDVSASGS